MQLNRFNINITIAIEKLELILNCHIKHNLSKIVP